VTLNPFGDDVRICRNPLERLLPPPVMHEYDHRVISHGHRNNPAGDPPRPRRQAHGPLDGEPRPVDGVTRVSLRGLPKIMALPLPARTGALSNAVTELRAAAGFRNPDIGLHFQVVEIGGQVGGFTLNTAVFVSVKSG
jgi:hypothetical protein